MLHQLIVLLNDLNKETKLPYVFLPSIPFVVQGPGKLNNKTNESHVAVHATRFDGQGLSKLSFPCFFFLFQVLVVACTCQPATFVAFQNALVQMLLMVDTAQHSTQDLLV